MEQNPFSVMLDPEEKDESSKLSKTGSVTSVMYKKLRALTRSPTNSFTTSRSSTSPLMTSRSQTV